MLRGRLRALTGLLPALLLALSTSAAGKEAASKARAKPARTAKVGKLKAQHGLPPADPAREERQIARLKSLAVEADLDPEFAADFLDFIIAEVIRHHEALQA